MSKKNYNKISTDKAKAVEEVVEETVSEVIEEVVEEVNAVEPVETEEPKYFEGVVANCSKLNVRTNPKTDAKVECVIPEGTVVVIFPDKSNDEWVNVVTEAGVEGYCMKKFISIKK